MRNIHVFKKSRALRLNAFPSTSTFVAVVLALIHLGCSFAAAAPKISMMPSYTQSQVYANTGLNEAITVWGRTWNGTAPYTYTLDYGDGTAAASGTASNPNFIGFAHTYTSAGLKTVTLTVTDSTGASASKTAMVRVLISPTHQERVQMAIEKGLLNLYQIASVIDANRVYWPHPSGTGSTTTYSVGSTSSALLAFEENDHLPDEDDEDDVYAETVRRGLNTLFGMATAYNIGAAQHSDGIVVRDTDSNDNGRGIYFPASGGHETYSTPFAGMAMIIAKRNGADAQAATVPYGTFAGTNYYEFIRDIIDQMQWCQGDGSVRGAWEYQVATASQSRYDGSAQQWPTLLMLAAKDRFGIETPQWVLDNIVYGFKVLQSSNGGIGYSTNSSWRNLAKTGGGLAAFAFAGKVAGTDADATAALNFVQNYWAANPSWDADLAGWAGNWYAMWGLKKGLQLQGITTLPSTTTGARDWKLDMQAWLLGNGTLLNSQGGNIASSFRSTDYMFGQRSDGSWRAAQSPGAGASTSTSSQLGMDTAHGVLILSDAVTTPVPVAVVATIGSQSNKAGFRSFAVDGSGSYHLDLTSTIIEYLWDWDDSNGVDWNNPDATGPRPTNPGYSAVGTYTVSLRVKDNNDPAQNDVTTVQVQVVDTDISPVAVAKPPGTYPGYAGQVAEAIVLDGTGSYDPDGDAITDYAWDTDGDGQYDDATGATPTISFNAPYSGTIGLRVTANGRTSTNDAHVDVNVSADDLRLGTIVASNIVYATSADISVPIYNDSGGSFVASVQVKLYNGNPFLDGVQLGTTQTVLVPSGSSTTLNVTGLALNGAEFVWVFLDSNRVISEYDEENSLGFVPVGMKPEIAVAGNSTEIADGDSTPSTTDHTDFGSTLVTGGSVVRTFTITNSGTKNLTLSGAAPNYVTLSGAGAAAFSVTQQPSSGTIALEGGTRTFQVTFDPSAVGAHTATVTIANDDINEGTYDFSIQGTGAAPEIAVSGNGVNIANGDTTPSPADHTDFGSLPVAAGTVVRTFTITNSGTADLTLAGTAPSYVTLSGAGAAAFSVTTQPSSATVAAAGGTRTFQVTFDPSAGGVHNATVTITSNDADEGTYEILLTGAADSTPGIFLVGSSPLSVDRAATYTDAGATATDTEDGALTPVITTNTVMPNVPGIYTVTWSATDSAGVTITATRTVIVRPGTLDKTAPSVAITVPASSTVPGMFNIGGIVRDNYGIQSIVVKVNGVTLTLDTPLSFVANSNVPWSVSGLVPENGTNVIEVTTTDLNGKSVTVRKTVTFANRRPELAGTFCSLLEPTGTPSNDTFGMVHVTVTETGAFSGNVRIGGVSLPFSGVIQNDGQARFSPSQATTFPLVSVTYVYERQKKGQVLVHTISRDLGVLAFSVDEDDGVEGTISPTGGGAVLATFSGLPAPYRKDNLVPTAKLNMPISGTKTRGIYNIAFPSKAQTPVRAANLYPQGDGFAVLTLTNLGAASVAGNLADGTSYAASGVLRSDETVALYSPLYGNLGGMGGELVLANAADSDATGTDLLWVRPAQTGSAQYPAGWPGGVRMDATGTKYAAPASLNFGQGAVNTVLGNVSLDFADGLLSAPVSFSLSVNPANGALIKIPANNPSFTATFTPASGLLSGSFRHTNGTSLLYKGILLNKGVNQGAFGWFLTNGPNGQGGGVTLDPAGP